MVYTFARVNAALLLKVGDYEVRGRRGYLRLQEKGGKLIDAPCHHELDGYIGSWLEASGLAGKRALFPSIPGGENIVDKPMAAAQAKAKAAGLERRITNHSFRATGITAYSKNGGPLEVAQYLAGHADLLRHSCTTVARKMSLCPKWSASCCSSPLFADIARCALRG